MPNPKRKCLERRRPPLPRAKKSLGQNFLRDANIAAKIVRILDVAPDDSILEIGPGAGALTGFLMQKNPARLVLVEKDAHWATERMLTGNGKAHVVLADALSMPWECFSDRWKILGNLPYNVASPLMWDIFSRVPQLDLAVFMVQKEVALRITARPGNSAYGALSVWIQSFVRPRLEFIVPPQVFYPRPKVDSAVLSFAALREEKGVFSPKALALTLKACFQMRRKQLGVIAKAIGKTVAMLEDCGIAPELRPEKLLPEDFQRLSTAGFSTGRIDYSNEVCFTESSSSRRYLG